MQRFRNRKHLPAVGRPPAPPQGHAAVPAVGWWMPLLALFMAPCMALALAACEGTEGTDFRFRGVQTTNLDFNAPALVGVGNSPITMAAADFNGDLTIDLAVVNQFETVPEGQPADSSAPGTITILNNDGMGNFTFASEFPVGVLPATVIAQDVSNDGNPDLVLLNRTVSVVSVFLNDGAGGFTSQPDLDFSGLATQVSLIDLDNASPATPDIVVSVTDALFDPTDPTNLLPPGVIAVFLNDGFGGFPATPSTTTFLGATNLDPSTPTRFVSGDWDTDGDQDLAVINVAEDNVAILLGDGTGDFTIDSTIPVEVGGRGGPFDIVKGLFTADANQDLVVSNRFSVTTTASFLTGDGAGGFGTATIPISGNVGLPERMVTGNFSAPGLDVALLKTGGEFISLLDGDGAGTFVLMETRVGDEPFAINKGDFNTDGDLDLVVAEGELRMAVILAGTGAGGFTSTVVGFDTRTTFPTVLDVTGDGMDDLLMLHPGFDRVVVLINCHPAAMTPCP